MTGKTVKSKINGALFFVEELFEDNKKQYYRVIHLASGKPSIIGKEWFEKGYMQNLEIVKENTK